MTTVWLLFLCAIFGVDSQHVRDPQSSFRELRNLLGRPFKPLKSGRNRSPRDERGFKQETCCTESLSDSFQILHLPTNATGVYKIVSVNQCPYVSGPGYGFNCSLNIDDIDWIDFKSPYCDVHSMFSWGRSSSDNGTVARWVVPIATMSFCDSMGVLHKYEWHDPYFNYANVTCGGLSEATYYRKYDSDKQNSNRRETCDLPIEVGSSTTFGFASVSYPFDDVTCTDTQRASFQFHPMGCRAREGYWYVEELDGALFSYSTDGYSQLISCDGGIKIFNGSECDENQQLSLFGLANFNSTDSQHLPRDQCMQLIDTDPSSCSSLKVSCRPTQSTTLADWMSTLLVAHVSTTPPTLPEQLLSLCNPQAPSPLTTPRPNVGTKEPPLSQNPASATTPITTSMPFQPSRFVVVLAFRGDLTVLSESQKRQIRSNIIQSIVQRSNGALTENQVRVFLYSGSINANVEFLNATSNSVITDLVTSVNDEPITITADGINITSTGISMTDTNQTPSNDGPNIGMIVGVSVVGAFVTSGIIMLLCCCRHTKQDNDDATTFKSAPHSINNVYMPESRSHVGEQEGGDGHEMLY